MTEESPVRLGLVAHDADDLAVVSAALQDAVLAVGSMAYLPEERSFALLATRFRWETDRPESTSGERVTSGLRFDHVRHVQFRGMDPVAGDGGFLSLLSISFADGAVTLRFSGSRAVRLTVDSLACSLKDLGAPWPTRWRPRHDIPEVP